MPKSVAPLSISAPGFYGLNKQQAGGILPVGWATEALNCVIDEAGRITSRKGNLRINAASFTGTARAFHEYTDNSGNSLNIFSAGIDIYKVSGSTVTSIKGTITAPTADNWKLVNFNGACYGVQYNHDMISLATVAGSFADVTTSGTQQPTSNVDSICSAFGRLWALDGTDLKYSDLLDGTAWNGAFDLSKYWQSGVDEGIAVEEFNGFLIVFGKNNIIVFNNPYDPASTMQIVENIGGIGCIARDSIQNIGTDLLFLSNSGVRSLGRTIQEKSMPVNDITKNVRDYLLSLSSSETKSYIKSVYSPLDGFYILSFPTRGRSFCIDVRGALPDGSSRITEWSIAPTAMMKDKTSIVYFGYSSYITKYDRYRDNIVYDGSGGVTYTMSWEGAWSDFGDEVRPFLKIPKRLSILMGGVLGKTATIKWAFDYSDSFSTANITFDSGTVAQYGISQYGLSYYSGALQFRTGMAGMNKSGQVIKFGVSVPVDGSKAILQRIDLMAKVGRLSV